MVDNNGCIDGTINIKNPISQANYIVFAMISSFNADHIHIFYVKGEHFGQIFTLFHATFMKIGKKYNELKWMSGLSPGISCCAKN